MKSLTQKTKNRGNNTLSSSFSSLSQKLVKPLFYLYYWYFLFGFPFYYLPKLCIKEIFEPTGQEKFACGLYHESVLRRPQRPCSHFTSLIQSVSTKGNNFARFGRRILPLFMFPRVSSPKNGS